MSWFKNLQVYRIPTPFHLNATQLDTALSTMRFAPGSSIEMQTVGWISPLDNDQLVHNVQGQMFFSLCTEKKLLPASVINQFVKEKVTEITEQEGFKPGRKRIKEIKEETTDELLPKAFAVRSTTRAWIDSNNGWLVIDASNGNKAAALLSALLKCVDKLAPESLRTERSPLTAMTNWLLEGDAPSGLTIDQDTELRSIGESKAKIRVVGQSMEEKEIHHHIVDANKKCSHLALTWNDRLSFVLTDNLTIKRVRPLEVMHESADKTAQTSEDQLDADMFLMASELNDLLNGLTDSLGGIAADDKVLNDELIAA